MVIPAGALDQPTEIGIARDGSGAPELGGLRLISSVYAITPHGTQFAESARISIPFNPADVAPGTQPIIIESQPGGTWTALISDGVGNSLAADSSGLSYYAVGTCYTSRDVLVAGPDPLLYCPASQSLQLRLQDGSGVWLPVPRTALGTQLPAMTISTLTTLNFNAEYNRLAGINRNDLLSVWAFGAGLLPSQQPLTDFVVNNTSIPPTWVVIDPSKVPLAGKPGGVVIRIKAWVTYTTDAFYPGCVCFKPASWTFEAEVPVRVIYTAPPVPTGVTYTIGGTVSGLTGTGLVLRNNGGDNRAVTANGAFTFANTIGAGAPYSVSVLTQPSGQTCTVQNGSGTANVNVANVAVRCAAVSAVKAWQGALLLEADPGDAYSPQVLFDANGNGMAIWTQHDGTYLRIRSRRYLPGSGWSTVMPVDNGGAAMAQNPKIAADGLGNMMAVWLQTNAGVTSIWTNLYSASSGWGTAALMETVNLVGGNNPEIAMDPAGNATVVWYAFDGVWTNLLTKRYTASGVWGQATLIENDNTGGVAGNRVAMDANGNAMVVWAQYDGTHQNILANRYRVGYGWGGATLIEASDLTASNPSIAVDGAGNIMVVWHQQADAASTINYSIYTNRFANGSWGAATLVKNSIPYGTQSAIAMNASGNAMLVWLEDDGSDTTSIWARAYTAAGVGGATARIDDLSTYTTGGRPQVGMDASGNALAVWGQGRHIWSARYVAGTGWGIPTDIDSAAATFAANQPRIAVDTNGNALVVWERSGGTVQDAWSNVFK